VSAEGIKYLDTFEHTSSYKRDS